MRQYSNQIVTQHYFNQASQDTKQYFPLKGKVAGYALHLKSAKGVFSAEEFDKGTSILLKHFKKYMSFGLSVHQDSQRYLDLGCGYGIVSAWLLAHYGATGQSSVSTYTIDAVDSSPLAVDLTTTNMQSLLASGVGNIVFSAHQSDVLADIYFKGKMYDCILTNPPFSAGKKTVQQFIQQSYRHLRAGGELRVVAPTNRGAKTYITYTQELFGEHQVEVMALESGFRVWRSTKAIESSV